jgi:hypothetical protein
VHVGQASGRHPPPLTAMVISTSRSSGDSRSTRSAITSCTVCETGTSRPAPTSDGTTIHSPERSSIASSPWANMVLSSSIRWNGLPAVIRYSRAASRRPPVGTLTCPISWTSCQTSSSLRAPTVTTSAWPLARRARQRREAGASRSTSPGVSRPSHSTGECSSRRVRKRIRLQLSSSHHCKSSMTTASGRSAAIATRSCATPSNRRHPSAACASRAAGSAGKRSRSSGTRRATSTSHSGEVAAKPGAARAQRNASTTGSYGVPARRS